MSVMRKNNVRVRGQGKPPFLFAHGDGCNPDGLLDFLHDNFAGAIAPAAVGNEVHRAMPRSTLVRMRATGPCPNLGAPDETIAAIRAWLD